MASPLIEEYIPMARGIAKPYQWKYKRYRDEFESTCLWALFQAWRKYEDRGLPFKVVAFCYVKQRMIDVERSILSKKCINTNDIEIEEESDKGGEWGYDDLVKCLSEMERDVCKLIYCDGLRHREIGVVLGITRETVTRRHLSSLSRIKDYISGYEYCLDYGRKWYEQRRN